MLQPITLQNFQQLLGRFTTAELENLVQKSPYFQQAHLLLAKKYQLENNPKFDQQLQIAALYTQDRELLFNLFNEKLVPPAPVVKPVEEKQEEVKPAITFAPVVEPVVTTPVIETKAEEPVEEVKTAPVEEVKQEVIEPVTEEKKKEINVTPLEEPVVEVQEVETVEIETSTEPVKEEVEETPKFSVFEPHTFDEWIKAFNKQAPEKAKDEELPPLEQVEDELNKLIMQNTPVDYLHDLVKEETSYSKGLDKFIEEQIQKRKNEVVVKPETEKDIDNELITETMAKVYEMQKKYNKAIKAYEVLTLKYPEKSGLFAARISYLKNLI